MKETTNAIIVYPHENISKEVTTRNLKRVHEDAERMFDLCYGLVHSKGGLKDLYALAHAQITDNPLRFFVLNFYSDRIKNSYFEEWPPVIINPVILRHTAVPQPKKEGCATFKSWPMKDVLRYAKLTVEFQAPENVDAEEWVLKTHTKEARGLMAQIWQHEIDHLNGIYIHDINLLKGNS